MYIEKVLQSIKERKKIRYIFIAILIIIAILYMKVFLTKGVYLGDTFLKKQSLSDEIHYVHKSKSGDMEVMVKGKADITNKSSAEVIVRLSENSMKSYFVNFNNGWLNGEVEIKDERERTVFEGVYRKNSMFLYDKKGTPVFEDFKLYVYTEQEIKNYNYYELSYKKIIDFALLENESIRGEPGPLMFALLLLFFTIIDIKYPLFFFTLSNSLSVKDPEPTEFYIAMQKFSWVVSLIISFILLIFAI